MRELLLPYKFNPRKYQVPFFESFDKGIHRIILIHHRRAGKDKICWNLLIREAWEHIGNYYYAFPTYAQAKKALWEGRGKDGVKYLDHIPKQIVEGKFNDTELKIKLINGSIIQLVGVEDPDKVVGTNPRGIVFSEYSLQNPKAWD